MRLKKDSLFIKKYGIFITVLILLCNNLSSQTIQTVIGNKTQDSGILATNMRLGSLNSIAIDSVGNIYFTEDYYIKKKDVLTGLVSIVAGTGNKSTSTGSLIFPKLASTFSFFNPINIALDRKGFLYCSDNNVNLTKINLSTGIMTSVAGGKAQFGDFNGDGGLATNSTIPGSGEVLVDSLGNIYFKQDYFDVRIRKIDITTGIINTIAGGNQGTSSIDGVLATKASINANKFKIDKDGNIYFVEDSKIRKIDKNTGLLSTIAGLNRTIRGDGGLAINTVFGYLSDLAIDYNNNIYVIDNSSIRKISGLTGIVSTIAGNDTNMGDSGDNGLAVNALLGQLPCSIEVDFLGNIFVVDKANFKVRKINISTGIITSVIGVNKYSGDGEAGLKANINKPSGLAIDKSGNMYFVDRSNFRVRKLDATSGLVSTVVGNGLTLFNSNFLPDLKSLYNGKLAKEISLFDPIGVALDSNNYLYIIDKGRNTGGFIAKVNLSSGIINLFAGGGTASGLDANGKIATNIQLGLATALTIDKNNNIYFTQWMPSLVYKVNAISNITTIIAGNGKDAYAGDYGQANAASLFYPSGVALDTLGNVYITDHQNQCIRKVTASSGVITTIGGIAGAFGFEGDGGPSQAGMFMNPTSLSIDKKNNLYILDNDNNRIRKIDSKTGIIYTIAGTGNTSYNGEGLNSTSTNINTKLSGSRIDFPGICVASDGSIYYSDLNNSLIRKITDPNKVVLPDPSIANPPHKITIHKNKRVASLEMTPSEFNDWVTNDFFTYEPKSIPVFQDIYSRFGDKFDHIVFILNEMRSPSFIFYGGVNKAVQNSTKGIGRDLIDYSQAYGSNGRLKSIIQLVSPSGIMYGPFLHELAHQYANFGIYSADQFESTVPARSSFAHWGFAGGSSPGQLGGFKQNTLKSNVEGIANKYSAKAFGSIANGGNSVPYNDLELYMMGMTPLNSVNDFDQFKGIQDITYVDTLTKFTATTKIHYTKDTLQTILGARIPSSATAQKDFNALFIVITPRALIDTEWTKYDEQIKQMTLKGDEGTPIYNFWEATNGIGTLNADSIDKAIVSGNIALISPKNLTAICEESTLTFRAYPLDNGGKSSTYSWTKNGIVLPDETSFVFTSTDLKNNDIIRCKISNSLDSKISDSIKILINQNIISPKVADTLFCQNVLSNSLSAVASAGSSLLWYGNYATGGTSSSTASNAITTDTVTRSYYVSQILNSSGCESPRAKITVKITPAPALPSVRDTAYCNNSVSDTLRATNTSGNTLVWYGNSSTGGTAASIASKPSTTIVGTQNYYVSQKNSASGCEGTRAKIGVIIYPLPVAPVVKDTSYCNNAVSDSLKTNSTVGNTLLWYGVNATGGTSSNLSSKPNTTTVGTQNYYVSQITTATGCEGLRAKIGITIKPIPSAPSLSRDTANFLQSGTAGTTWFKDGIALTDTATETKYKPTTGGSYTAKTTVNGCISVASAPYYYLVTDIINLSANEFIKLAPNPFQNNLNFDFNVKGYQKLNVEVFDLATGNKVASNLNLTPGTSINLGMLISGNYVVRVSSSDNKLSYQFKMVKM